METYNLKLKMSFLSDKKKKKEKTLCDEKKISFFIFKKYINQKYICQK